MSGDEGKRKGDSGIEISLPSKKDALEMEAYASDRGFSSVSEYLLELYTKDKEKPLQSAQTSYQDTEKPELFFENDMGQIYLGDSASLMREHIAPQSIDLIMTSPPFGLVRKKVYGNEDADQYVSWFSQFAEGFVRVLKPGGSLVVDIGGAWKKGQPTRSLYHFELLIFLCREFGFHLTQEFYWWNPAKLPTPAEWVNVRRIRVKDAINCIWWLSPTPYPKATNRRVLQPYSHSMKQLLETGYRAKRRPSGHDISKNFRTNNKGAIPPNLIALANTESNSYYQRYCRDHDLPEHPARFPEGIPSYFIRMLTDVGDVVFDPFAGSCMTAVAAEKMGRRWLCCELERDYVEGALGRFQEMEHHTAKDMRREPYEIYPPILDLLDESDAPLPKDGGRSRPPKE